MKKLRISCLAILSFAVFLNSCGLLKSKNASGLKETHSLKAFSLETMTEHDSILQIRAVSKLPNQFKNKELNIEGISLCNTNMCYQKTVSTQLQLGDLDDVYGQAIADIVLPSGDFTELYIQTSIQDEATDSILSQDPIVFTSSISLEAVISSALYVSFNTSEVQSTLNVEFLAHNNIHGENNLIFIVEPDHAISVSGKDGFKLEIPTQAVLEPTIFSVIIHDRGPWSTMYLIQPIVEFLKPVKVTIPVGTTLVSSEINKVDVITLDNIKPYLEVIPIDSSEINKVDVVTLANTQPLKVTPINP